MSSNVVCSSSPPKRSRGKPALSKVPVGEDENGVSNASEYNKYLKLYCSSFIRFAQLSLSSSLYAKKLLKIMRWNLLPWFGQNVVDTPHTLQW